MTDDPSDNKLIAELMQQGLTRREARAQVRRFRRDQDLWEVDPETGESRPAPPGRSIQDVVKDQEKKRD